MENLNTFKYNFDNPVDGLSGLINFVRFLGEIQGETSNEYSFTKEGHEGFLFTLQFIEDSLFGIKKSLETKLYPGSQSNNNDSE